MAVLSGLAQILMEPEQAEALRSSSSVDEVLELLSGLGEDGRLTVTEPAGAPVVAGEPRSRDQVR